MQYITVKRSQFTDLTLNVREVGVVSVLRREVSLQLAEVSRHNVEGHQRERVAAFDIQSEVEVVSITTSASDLLN